MLLSGIDLAWRSERNGTGLVSLEPVLAKIDRQSGLQGVAIDAPLIIRNASGQRPCERLIGGDRMNNRGQTTVFRKLSGTDHGFSRMRKCPAVENGTDLCRRHWWKINLSRFLETTAILVEGESTGVGKTTSNAAMLLNK